MDFISALLTAIIAAVSGALLTVDAYFMDVSKNIRFTIAPPSPTEFMSPASVAPSESITVTPATTTQKKKTAAPKAKPLTSTIAVAAPSEPIPTPPPSTVSLEALNEEVRRALVNVYCSAQQRSSVRPISASGVFIDSRGVILTNAHVAQLFLLKDYPTPNNIECVIRVGNPAEPRYRATLLFLPKTWIERNADQLIAAQAKGTGEHDYAFLLVTGTTDGSPLPPSFPYLPMTFAEPDTGAQTLLAAYSAGFLEGVTIQNNLYITSAYAVVKELFTFAERTVDLVSVGGTIVSQAGSSGGAMVRTRDGTLQGIIVTSTAAETTAQRDLRALTLDHINRSLAVHGKGNITSILSKSLTEEAANFAAQTAPEETQLLIKVLENR
ncbi:MAG TPA: trypsin-like peptidase domain-containing protein [Candidatus Paceibacterota bacterium]|nr:trypsin-like peptidase domain-containing protein [Candidatus Paceibacterota bacterium]